MMQAGKTPVSFIGRYGHIMQFAVISSSRPVRHTVDLDAESLMARCSCEHFEHRIMSEQHILNGSACKHLLAIRTVYHEVVEPLIQITGENQ